MTTYGTIPTGPSSSSSLDYISRAKERGSSALSARRPWKEMIHRGALGCPSSLGDTYGRIRRNMGYFRMNYAIIVLIIVFLSLLWHPISLIVFIVLMVAWLFLYFLRGDEPLVIFHRTIDDRIVLVVLGIITIVALFLTHATLNIIVSLIIGVVIIILHAILRKTDDMFVGEEEAALVSVESNGKRPMTTPSPSS